MLTAVKTWIIDTIPDIAVTYRQFPGISPFFISACAAIPEAIGN